MHLYREAVLAIKGAPPKNNFKTLRLAHHLTIKDLTELASLSKQAIIRTEQGVYDDPPEGLVSYWLNKGIGYNKLYEDYKDFQVNVREQHHKLFGDVSLKDLPLDLHPQAWLRRNWSNPPVGGTAGDRVGTMNKTELAKLLCVNQSVVDYFESHVNKQQSVPFKLSYALRDNGYSVTFLEELDEAYAKHRNWVLNGGITRG